MAKYQKVFLRIVGMVGDKPTDEDKFPDRVMSTGTWFLKPNIRDGAAENAYGPDGIAELELPNSISGEIVNGMLTYNGDPYVWLRVSEEGWNWQLSFPQLRVDGIAKKLDSFSFDLTPATNEQLADSAYAGINLAPLIEFVNPNTGQKAVKGDTGWSLIDVNLVGTDQLEFLTNNPNPIESNLGTITIPTIVEANNSAQLALDAASVSVTSSEMSTDAKDASVIAQGLSEAARDASITAKTAAETARDASVTAKTASEGARDTALTHKTAAETAKTASEAARDASVTAKTASETARDASVTAKTASETAKTASETARDASVVAKTASETAKTGSETARDASVAAKVAAELARDQSQQGVVPDNAVSTIKIQNGAVTTAKIEDATRQGIAKLPQAYANWHDVFAFGSHVGYATFETRLQSSGVWSAGTLDKGPFAQLEALKTTVLTNGDTNDAVRYTWTGSNVAYNLAEYFIIGLGYVAGARNVEFKIERSTDGSAWETVATDNVSGSGLSRVIALGAGWGNYAYMRLTVTRTSGTEAVILTTVEAITNRKGDQGGGKEKSLPIAWDKDKRIGIGSGTSGSLLRIGADTTDSTGGMQFGSDTYLYRMGSGQLKTNGSFEGNAFTSGSAPSGANHLTRKDYVDSQVGAKYTKPGSGIPSSDMAAAVVTSLGKADTAIQQAGLDAAKLVTINAQTASYTLVLADGGKAVEVTSASATNVTVPPNSSVAFPVGTVIEVTQVGAGKVNIVQGAGVTINNAGSLGTRAQWSSLVLRKRATDTWLLTGDMA